MTQSPVPQNQTPDKDPQATLCLEQTIYNLSQLRKAELALPQVALAGRSNVGKSSLLNALAKRRQLAKISATPGKTRSLNLFHVLPDDFLITDLPGYGYARRSKSERHEWGELIEYYLKNNPLLKAVVLLLDCRLSPQELDRRMADFCLAHAIRILPVLTKADKVGQKEKAERQKEWAVILQGRKPLPVSSKTGQGLPDLWRELRMTAGNSASTQAGNEHAGSVQAE